jgi:CubicO group peptidase (beta-lactamase class C family)
MNRAATALGARIALVALASGLSAGLGTGLGAAELYFPPAGGAWQTIAPEVAGWRSAGLEAALDFAGKRGASEVVILHRGRVLAERVYALAEPSPRYQRMLVGRTEDGRPIEDVASVQKSVASFLAGVAEGKGLLELDAPVTRHLEAGWSRAAPEQEARITVRHLMTMTSGLDVRGRFEAAPGALWRYNTSVYARLIPVLEAVAGKDVEALSSDWLTARIGMADSGWRARAWVTGDVDANRYGFATTARDLARFGLLILARGRWNGADVLGNDGYLERALATSQQLNPSYGLLWWLNGKERVVSGEDGESRSGPLVEGAPADLVAALGALGRKVWVVPGLELVVVRLGDAPGAGFDERFWELLSAARD